MTYSFHQISVGNRDSYTLGNCVRKVEITVHRAHQPSNDISVYMPILK